ncbi:MAG: YebC/PmpR family DNA-binding transcriptional regulator [Bacteroidales bacterium]
MGRAFEYRRASKEKRWDKMSKLFPRLGKAITIAAKEGGENPEMNPKLRTAIQNAKAQNMPKDNIDAAIKRAGGKDSESISEVLYEGKGPHGVLIVVECATDNSTRTVANIKSYFNKNGGQVVPTGSLEFLFKRMSVFQITATNIHDLEELELELIDYGLEDIQFNNDVVELFANYTDFGNLSQALEKMNIPVEKAELQRIPTSPVQLTDEQFQDIEKLLDKIEEDDDVQTVFTNIA